MKAIVIYDSNQGNTEKIAQAVAAGIAGGTKALKVDSAEGQELGKTGFLVLGSPTIGGRPTKAVRKYIESIPTAIAETLTAATFDTRMKMKFAEKFGYAAVRMAAMLEEHRIAVKSEPEGFVVVGKNGPLAEGELEREKARGKKLAKKL